MQEHVSALQNNAQIPWQCPFNRAARFLFYKGFTFFNRAARFLFFKGFILFFSFVGDQFQTSAQPDIESRNLWCLYAKNCLDISTRKMLQILFVYSSS